ncbi:hypothetical protein HDU81_003907 [Chytriomyces hyalinus]|nr:hypothetical protein HDU81_003907 [Chytriomyces hyalinus]
MSTRESKGSVSSSFSFSSTGKYNLDKMTDEPREMLDVSTPDSGMDGPKEFGDDYDDETFF